MGHIHGCGHPVKPVIMDDNVLSVAFYLEWEEEHDKAKEGECICFFCWRDQHSIKNEVK